jgi:tetratricopeptide (TPR) repeat protein
MLVVALSTFACFGPALANDFVNWDDPVFIVENPQIRQLDWPSIRWMFTTVSHGPYQPLVWVSWALDYKVWGLEPLGYHLTSLIWHVANAVSFYILSRCLLRLAQGAAATQPLLLNACAALSAIVFGMHPLRVESVVWASERRDVLSGFFALWAVWAYLQAGQRDRADKAYAAWLAVSWLLFAGSLLAKATAMGLPAILTVLDVYPLRRLGTNWGELWHRAARRIWLEKVPFWLLGIAAAAIAWHGQQTVHALTPLERIGLLDRGALALFATMFYLEKTAWPTCLSPFYELPANPNALSFLASAISFFALTAVVIACRRRLPALLAVWVCYLITLAPVSGLVHIGYQLAADRYSYLPCLGFALLSGALVMHGTLAYQVLGRWGVLPHWGLIIGGAIGLGVLSWRQSQTWHDSETLWGYALRVDPTSSTAHTNLGAALDEAGQQEPALDHFLQAARLNATHVDALQNVGLVLARRELMTHRGFQTIEEQWEAAAEWLRRALAVRSDCLIAKVRLQVVSARLLSRRLTQPDQPAPIYERAIRLDPENAEAHYYLGGVLEERGLTEQAAAQYRRTLALEPDHAGASSRLTQLVERASQLGQP